MAPPALFVGLPNKIPLSLAEGVSRLAYVVVLPSITSGELKLGAVPAGALRTCGCPKNVQFPFRGISTNAGPAYYK